jgi:type I restriction enzyme, S subunit
MTPQELKNSILQLAIQGKLVEQRPEEGCSEKLVQQLKIEKQRLVSSGLIYKKAPTKPFYDESDLFDIPDSWRWVQLSEASIIQEGAGIRTYQYRDFGIQILCVTNILEDSIDLNKKQLFISREEYEEKYRHLTLKRGDIVTSCSGGSWGKISFFNEDQTIMLNTSTLRLRFFCDLADNKYLYHVCKSQFFKRQLELQLSGMQPNFGYAHYSRIMIPLPPLAEQKRIVAKIEELLPYIDRYEQAWSRLEDFNKRFPGDMQKSILQIAIQGKLVEQSPEEGTGEELYQQIQAEKQKLIKTGTIKKEKPLPEITEDEIPFDVPERWKWIRVGEVFETSSGTTPLSSNPDYYVNGKYNWVRTTDLNNSILSSCDIQVSERAFTECNLKIIPRGSVCVAMYGGAGTIGKNALIAFDTTINQSVCAIHPNSYCDMRYVQILIQYQRPHWMDFASGSRKDPNINKIVIRKAIFPLPPLAEQKRIVAKLEEILPLCEKLK